MHEDDRRGSTWVAHQQEELDAELASWRAAHPHVAMSARIELGDEWLATLAAHSALLVVPAAALATGGRGTEPAWRHCPTAVVPPACRPGA